MPKLRLTVINCRDLDAKDRGGTSDPFVKIQLGTIQLRTEVIKKNCNPDWNATFFLDLPSKFNPESETINFEVFDYDKLVNDLIGKAAVALDTLERGVAQQMTLNLHNAQKGTLTIELFSEDCGIVYEKTCGQLSTTTQPPAYEDSAPPEYYDSQGNAYQSVRD